MVIIFLLLLIAAGVGDATSTVDSSASPENVFHEHQAMMEALRNHGSRLFSNAIATSDLQYELLATAAATAQLTVFAPKDSLLYALDMIADSATYVSTLRYHVIPNRRYSFRDLQTLASPFLATLLPHYSVLVGRTHAGDVFLTNDTVRVHGGGGVMIDGVRISTPDLFLGPTVAVHGIDGILVTGLSMYQDFEEVSVTGVSPPTESPATLSADLDKEIDFASLPVLSTEFYLNTNHGPPLATAESPPPQPPPPPPEAADPLKQRQNLVKSKRGRSRGNHRRRLRGHRFDDL